MKKLSIFMLLMMLVGLVIWQPQSAYADELSGHMHESGLRYLISKEAYLKMQMAAIVQVQRLHAVNLPHT